MKITNLMNCLWKTRFLPLIISITQDGVTIYIDGAHVVHADLKGHSSLYATQERGAMINVSKKLGIVTNSSTQTELVSTEEYMPKCTWFRYFCLGQGDKAVEYMLAKILNKRVLTGTRASECEPCQTGKTFTDSNGAIQNKAIQNVIERIQTLL